VLSVAVYLIQIGIDEFVELGQEFFVQRVFRFDGQFNRFEVMQADIANKPGYVVPGQGLVVDDAGAAVGCPVAGYLTCKRS